MLGDVNFMSTASDLVIWRHLGPFKLKIDFACACTVAVN